MTGSVVGNVLKFLETAILKNTTIITTKSLERFCCNEEVASSILERSSEIVSGVLLMNLGVTNLVEKYALP